MAVTKPAVLAGERTRAARGSLLKDIARDRYLYLLLLPGLLLVLVFKYMPMYGVVIAFQEYNIYKGISGSEWVGFDQFTRLFHSPDFGEILGNTIVISLYKLAASFTLPIVLALLLNELRSKLFKRFAQSVVYLPHFISWVIFSGILITFLNPVDGLINTIIQNFGGRPIDFLGDVRYFRSVLVISDVYKEIGWGTIIYLAAIAGVNADLYEAARIDGAGKLKQTWHVTLPAIRPVILILLILSLANILEAGFQQIFLLYSPLVYDVADIIDTYVYRVGIQEANYSYATAAGLFKSAVAMALILSVNTIVKKSGQEGLW
ncbi:MULTISPECIES: ABC transporter permease subunit [unclassified Paenibacillus]|uniref:ABC transporter permease n=1 Tax=unclassified Paenibacillus TaxID=185978 RepID=UPI000953A787|nr:MULTISPECIES: ABC transporter permease subunit [unclassified Paenibacillus]ASS68554.1 sugar ABC transporter permease [Paenibacillus sp. RUD330]SIR63254.1 putative aldouronate transport system permease protein [Paenibacillus sp. RU4X]SIR71724.1 putative aldouronate transport system permease protein [Paenibacillus sp. RU4T]